MAERPPKRAGNRQVHPDELHLWRHVTAGVVPLSRGAGDARQLSRETQAPQHQELPAFVPRPVEPVRQGASEASGERASGVSGAPSLGTFGARPLRQIARGQIAVDGVLDLHGMRQSEAHGSLKRFLLQMQARGARYVTVITGKGRGGDDDAVIPNRERGVLRRVVRTWLEDPEFRSLVVSYTTAARSHGGEGALFVHIRKANRPRRSP